jgi:hypothetical protein
MRGRGSRARDACSPEHAAAELRSLAAQGALDHRAIQAVLGAAGRGELESATPSVHRILPGFPAAKWMSYVSPQEDSRRGRSPTSCSSPRRPPITTSSTSTTRSACRHELLRRFGPCSTPPSNRRSARYSVFSSFGTGCFVCAARNRRTRTAEFRCVYSLFFAQGVQGIHAGSALCWDITSEKRDAGENRGHADVGGWIDGHNIEEHGSEESGHYRGSD